MDGWYFIYFYFFCKLNETIWSLSSPVCFERSFYSGGVEKQYWVGCGHGHQWQKGLCGWTVPSCWQHKHQGTLSGKRPSIGNYSVNPTHCTSRKYSKVFATFCYVTKLFPPFKCGHYGVFCVEFRIQIFFLIHFGIRLLHNNIWKKNCEYVPDALYNWKTMLCWCLAEALSILLLVAKLLIWVCMQWEWDLTGNFYTILKNKQKVRSHLGPVLQTYPGNVPLIWHQSKCGDQPVHINGSRYIWQ